MKNYKMIMALLALFIISMSFVGCEDKHTHSFSPSYDEQNHFEICSCGEKRNATTHGLEWVVDREATDTIKGTKHLECSCGYKAEENTPIPIAKKEDGTLKLDDKLIQALSEYLRDFYVCYDIPELTFGWKIEMCKSKLNPILAKYGDECYYVAAYYNATHDRSERFCCYDEYTWVGFERADEIRESWDSKAFVAAFQINPAEFCQNIKTGETDYVTEHFTFYTPEFKDGKALAPEISFDSLFILLTESDEKVIYYTSKAAIHEVFSFDCIELDGEYFIKYLVNIEYNDGSFYESDLLNSFGTYYDDLMKVIIVDKYYEKEERKTENYALFSIESLAKIIRGEK